MAKKSIKKVVKKVEKPLTKKQEKIVAILKDAISQLQLEAYKATTGSYVDGKLDGTLCTIADYTEQVLEKDIKKLEVKKYLPSLVTPKKPCEVCAKGSILLSSIRKFNNLSLFKVREASNDGDTLDSIASDRAQDILGKENADVIEDFFELNCSNATNLELKLGCNEDGDSHYDLLLDKWGDMYPEPKERLIAIFKNAIKNKGTFEPEQI